MTNSFCNSMSLPLKLEWSHHMLTCPWESWNESSFRINTYGMCRKTFPFPVRSMQRPFCSVPIHDLFIFHLQSILILFEVCVHFSFISNPLYIRLMFVSSVHMAVYGFYEVHMQGSSSCAVRRKIASLTAQL